MTQLRPWVAIIWGGLAALALVTVTLAQDDRAEVRVVHASPDAPAVDVYIDGTAVLRGVEFFAASAYLDVPAGAHQVQIVPAGQQPAAAVIDEQITVAGGDAYTVAAMGRLADIRPVLLNDDRAAPPEGQADVRVVHASPNAPPINVAIEGGETLATNLAFTEASDYVSVPASTATLASEPGRGQPAQRSGHLPARRAGDGC